MQVIQPIDKALCSNNIENICFRVEDFVLICTTVDCKKSL